MLERDRIEIRKWKAQIAAEEAAQREAEERPVREAVERLNELHRKIYSTVRERILTMSDEDENGNSECWIDPSVQGLQLEYNLAMKCNAAEYESFLANNPWFWHDPEQFNMGQLFAYFARQRGTIEIFSAEMYLRAARRLAQYGILKERPPEPPKPEPVEVNFDIDRSAEPPAPIIGWDEQTGLEREFTQREVDRLSADQYRRIFRVKRSDMILPNAGPGPMGFRG
jgi:hypothetical protein